ncbi:Replicative DNA helicase [Methyloligella halotolerans]|uniref:Replicative DNA helicase n=1 Tax=Methyloligella halotolerans TaxID=1177755 RepID=A0A1E2S1Q2_9HYPH|nr:DNA helicase [Methyloligella halotolerans]ODA68433.1 Replicative DNA helicase [Methyloligella halotolerans]
MKLSAPIYRLKHQAKQLARQANIPLHTALDRVARQEGYSRWSLLAAKHADAGPATRLFPKLRPGELMLLGARPGQGKTLLGLEIVAEAIRQGTPSWVFSLEETEETLAARFRDLGLDTGRFDGLLNLDCSDAITAAHIVGRLEDAPRGTLVLVDYLQLLDQRRETPPLAEQVRTLKVYAEERGHVVICLSQIDRRYDAERKPCPDIRDVRLPNALDVALFDKSCFLQNGKVQLSPSP